MLFNPVLFTSFSFSIEKSIGAFGTSLLIVRLLHQMSEWIRLVRSLLAIIYVLDLLFPSRPYKTSNTNLGSGVVLLLTYLPNLQEISLQSSKNKTERKNKIGILQAWAEGNKCSMCFHT